MSGKRDAEYRTGKYGGDDGALENEREETRPGEDTGLTGTPTAGDARGGETQAKRKQDRDLESGEENPG
jgi:hypothetical protein